MKKEEDGWKVNKIQDFFFWKNLFRNKNIILTWKNTPLLYNLKLRRIKDDKVNFSSILTRTTRS
jgi:hypothetical protein